MTAGAAKKRNAVLIWAALGSALVTGCFDSIERKPPELGGETHFMMGCEESCEGGLSCVCGVCTTPCDTDANCSALGAHARCSAVDTTASACGLTAPARACAMLCGADDDCRSLGDGFGCVLGQCRPAAAQPLPPVFEDATAKCEAGECARGLQPLVMLLVDTSGSMEYKPTCKCSSAACTECLPDCTRGERSRFTGLIEALTGTFDDYSCEALPRDEEHGATYDTGYFLPYHRPDGHPRADGVIDAYGERLRFALATFDGWDTYRGEAPLVPVERFDFERSIGWQGTWSYSPERELGLSSLLGPNGRRVGEVHYPGTETTYYIDTGIRSADAAEGALLVASDPAATSDVDSLHTRIKSMLRATRPYGGTPIAAALNDLYYLLAMDPRMAAERALPGPKYVVLITDGRPDWDYRDLQCDCAEHGDPMDPYRCSPESYKNNNLRPAYDPQLQRCPFPTPEDAAGMLYCGPAGRCSGPVEQLFVVHYGVDADQLAPDVRARAGAIASEGGSGDALIAADPSELRARLDELFDTLASER